MKLDELRKLLDSASPGPWQAEWPDCEGPRYVASSEVTVCPDTAVVKLREDQRADAHLIALAPDLARLVLVAADMAEALEGFACDCEEQGAPAGVCPLSDCGNAANAALTAWKEALE